MPRGASKKAGAPARGVTLADVDDHFRTLTRNLGFQRRNEALTDVRFVCHHGGKVRTVMAHKTLFLMGSAGSGLMTELFKVARAEQPGQVVCITLDDVDASTVEKLLEYLYLGQTTVKKQAREDLSSLTQALELDITLMEERDSSDEVEDVSPAKKPSPKGTKGGRTGRRRDSEDEDSDTDRRTTHKRGKTQDESDDDLPIKKKPGPRSRGKRPEKVEEETEVIDLDTPKKTPGRRGRPPKKTDEAKVVDSGVEGRRGRSTSVKVDDDSDTDSEDKKPLKSGKGKPTKKTMEEDDAEDPAAEYSDDERQAELERKARSIRSEVRLEPIDKSSKVSVKRIYQAALEVSNGGSEEGPRRPAKRARESKSRSATPATIDSDDDYLDQKSPPAKKRRGRPPKSTDKPAADKHSSTSETEDKSGNGHAAPEISDLYATEDIKCCNICRAIYVTEAALKAHIELAHDGVDNKPSRKPSERDGSDSDEGRSRARPASSSGRKKKSAAKVQHEREERESRSPSVHEIESDDEEEKPTTVKKRGRTTAKQTSPAKPVVDIDGSGESRSCKFCDYTAEKVPNLRNHVLNHFKEQLMAELPTTKPFCCPDCKAPSRDKITLLRHYAFSHKKIFNYCDEKDLAGTGLTNGGPKKGRKPKQKKTETSDEEKDDNEERKSSHSDDDDRFPAKKPVNEDDDDDPLEIGSSKPSSSKVEPYTAPVMRFSDDSDDDAPAKKSASDAIKSFDDLFGEADGKKEQPSKKNVVFNKDSDEEEEEEATRQSGTGDEPEMPEIENVE